MKEMKCVILGLLLIMMADSARVEAQVFSSAEPAMGSTVQASPSEVSVLFTEKIEPALSTVQVFETRQAKKWTNTMCIWIARRTTRCCTFLYPRLKLEATRLYGA